MNTRQRLSFSFPQLWYSLLEFNSRKNSQHLTNWTSWKKRDKVWSSANSLYKWRFRSSRHVCCSSSLATVWTATVQTWTSRSHTSKIVPERLVERVWWIWWTRSHSSVDSSPRSYLSTSATVRISVHTALKSGTEPIRYLTLHFRDRSGAPSLCYRNRAETFVFANKRECCKLICGPTR